ncbi:MAG: hypothetical protein KDK97_14620 [Verrucomicrobiales bacterium]|nr:hypothetical protein [Verrucomicrobiales bacterium]MCP5559122.1 hypothetical protein [Verrucomicrobiaceae bacterium]
MKITKNLLIALAAFALVPAIAKADAIEDVMKGAFKGETSLFKKVTTNKGSKDEAAKLAEWCAKLKGTTPPKGDAASWTKKVDALIDASKAAARGGAAGVAALRNAGNCKSCHQAHRED